MRHASYVAATLRCRSPSRMGTRITSRAKPTRAWTPQPAPEPRQHQHLTGRCAPQFAPGITLQGLLSPDDNAAITAFCFFNFVQDVQGCAQVRACSGLFGSMAAAGCLRDGPCALGSSSFAHNVESNALLPKTWRATLGDRCDGVAGRRQPAACSTAAWRTGRTRGRAR